MRKSVLIGCLLLVAMVGAVWLRALVRPRPADAPVVASAVIDAPTSVHAAPEPAPSVPAPPAVVLPPPPSATPSISPVPAAAMPVQAKPAASRAPPAASIVRIAHHRVVRRPASPPAFAKRRDRAAVRLAMGEGHGQERQISSDPSQAVPAPQPLLPPVSAPPAPVPAEAVDSAVATEAEAASGTIPAAASADDADVAEGAEARVPAESPTATPVETPASTETVVTLSAGSARIIRTPRPMAGVFVADDKIADVQVKGPDAFYLFAKSAGTTTVQTTDAGGEVTWSASIRVGVNLADAEKVLHAAMPEAEIRATPIAGILLLTGTVAQPADAADAQRLAEQVTMGSVPVLNRLKVATPQQVSLSVKIAEVNRSVSRAIGFNYKTADGTGGFVFGVGQGRSGAIADNLSTFTHSGVGTTLSLGGKLLGLDIRQVIDLAETDGLATTLAEPNLVALSGETASFLAGGEIPIPQSQGLGTVSVDYKQYGVSLSFTPTVMADGRIALRVRPEVSQLTDVGGVKTGDFTVPALITRRAETTVELGSGQSFAIGGLLQNSHNNSVDKAPILGDLPILGALFRSNSFKKSETELVIVVTPYIVKPVDANRIALPTDGYRSPTTTQRILGDASYQGTSGQQRPMPQADPSTPAPPVTIAAAPSPQR